MLLTGAEILVKCLLSEGVDTIFGYPGGAVLNIYDYLYKYKDKIKHYYPAMSKVQLMRQMDMQGLLVRLVFV